MGIIFVAKSLLNFLFVMKDLLWEEETMNKLFIIGNGFDRAHGLKTSYEDFHKYLKKAYPDADEDAGQLPYVYPDKDGELVCDDNEAVGFLMRIITQAEPDSEQWSALEESLGVLDYSEVFDDLIEPLDNEGDLDMWANAYQNEDAANDLFVVVEKLSDYFTNWIESIDLTKICPIPSFSNLIHSQDVFLNFNYTETLEMVYQVKDENVCHIHGKCGENLILGHGREEKENEYTDNMSYYTGAEGILSEIHYMLKKDIDKAISKHKNFFDLLLKNIDSIYSHGFSFGDVDQPYIKRICEIISTENVTWYLNDFDKNQLPKFEEQLRAAGFKGKILTFSI